MKHKSNKCDVEYGKSSFLHLLWTENGKIIGKFEIGLKEELLSLDLYDFHDVLLNSDCFDCWWIIIEESKGYWTFLNFDFKNVIEQWVSTLIKVSNSVFNHWNLSSSIKKPSI